MKSIMVESISKLISVAFSSAGERGKRNLEVSKALISFCTSRGIKRDSNQDHVAVFRISSAKENSKEIIIACLADGMGGTEKGKQAAQLSLSYFCAYIACQISAPLTAAVIEKAVQDTNYSVYKSLRGKGGATFSAVVYKGKNTFLVNIGDSRIYEIDGGDVDQLTVDDVLPFQRSEGPISENWYDFNLRDNRLLQNMGIDAKVNPFILRLDKNRGNLLLTSDGAHYVGSKMLQAIVVNSIEAQDIPVRLVAISEWLSGHDNATAMICPSLIDSSSFYVEDSVSIQVETTLKSMLVAIPYKDFVLEKINLKNFNKEKNSINVKKVETNQDVLFEINVLDGLEEK